MNKPSSLIDTLKHDNSNDEKDYKAFDHNRNKSTQKRLHIKQKGNVGSVISYAYITRIEYTGSTILSIMYHDAVITLKGHNLEKLIELLQDEKIRYLQEFDGNLFKEVTDKKTSVFIKDIDVLNVGQ